MRKATILRMFLGLGLAASLGLAAMPRGVQAKEAQQADQLSVSVDQNAKSGRPGSSVVYTFTVTNPGTTDENVTIDAPGISLGTVSAPGSVFVAANSSAAVQVAVNISPVTPPGSSEGIYIAFSDGGTAIASILITTTVSEPPALTPTTAVGASRPLVVVSDYYLDQDTIQVGDSFKLFLELHNSGEMDANNLILSFLNDSFLPQETGGVVALGSLGADGERDISQRFLVSSTLAGVGVGTIPVNLSYSDANGTAYTETFSITLQLHISYGSSQPTATPTQAEVLRPQLVVSRYQTDTDPLQPGVQFSLDLDVSNLGNADARAVTMVVGGGVTSDVSGTPVPGGLSGGSGDLSNFAPLGSSNLVYLGDLPAGDSTQANIRLIVNVSANPGAYPLKISFVYTDPKGNRLVDDQVITLLIYQLPSLEVNFYRDPGTFFAGQMASLPLQVVNLGRHSAVLGNMTVSADGVDVQNNTVLIGTLDSGGYFSLDATMMPIQPGPLTLKVVINYTDDFNAPREIEKTINIDVAEAPVMEPSNALPGEGDAQSMPTPVQENFWQKALRFVKGLVGLDSAPPETNPGMIETPSEGIPSDVQPIPMPSGGKGG
jgi:hypothetical protein